MTTETLETLVSLLAMERSLFRPFRQRDWGNNGRGRGSSTRHQLQREYRSTGLRLPGAGNAAERKNKERRLAEMIDDDLVVSGGGDRRTHWRLSDQGRLIAAALAFVPSAADAWFAVRQLLTFAPAGTLVSELLPAGLPNYGDENAIHDILWTAELLLPALVAGWCETFSDLHGRAAYKVTPEGEAAAAEPEPVPPDDLPAEDEELIDLYWRVYGSEVERLLRIATPDPRDCAPLPLSSGLFCNIAGPWNRKNEP